MGEAKVNSISLYNFKNLKIHLDLPFMMVPIEGNTVGTTISKAGKQSSTQVQKFGLKQFFIYHLASKLMSTVNHEVTRPMGEICKKLNFT